MNRFAFTVGFLLFAWVCANCAPRGGAALVDWVRGGVQFSHQEQLARGVRDRLALVAAHEAQHDDRARAARAESTPSRTPSAVANSGPVKFEFGMWSAETLPLPPAMRAGREVSERTGPCRTGEVPVPVPRGGAA